MSDPARGVARAYSVGTPEHVDQACKAAEDAFWTYGYSTRAERTRFLHTIADEIEQRADVITEVGSAETGLPEARLQGERGRTVNQLRLFGDYIQQEGYLDLKHDHPLPDRKPLPRADLRIMQQPVGPVAVFGSSNFPLAFSTAGGDTAAALAAGCPVIVKGHPSHPGTGEIVAEAIHAAIHKCGVHSGVFSFIHSEQHDVGEALVEHPLVCAVGFTGSLVGGRALFNRCAARPVPIPFYGELGSINPIFLLPTAIDRRGVDIAKAWAGSLTLGVGQFCTNPGVAIVPQGAAGDTFTEATMKALSEIGPQTMLNKGIVAAFCRGRDRVAGVAGVSEVLASACEERSATPHLYEATGDVWLENRSLGEEVFGPLGLVVRSSGPEQSIEIARSLEGQLTATLHMEEEDSELASRLMPILRRKTGRLLANGFPTGVEVTEAMIHGGPYPASTNFGATSVGTLSIRRFLRPVCYQNIPEAILPEDLR
ncbi:MAG: aldehyde dehydrogenase (NADP(+)) [Myxococcales bacterium]|nr:aldehyde dehydrogenase (NADP(+)) [Myxococcales bacterium]